MKTAFRTALLVIPTFILLVSPTAFAMGRHHGEGHFTMPILIKKHLNLSESQQAEIEQLTAGQHETLRAFRKQLLEQVLALDPETANYDSQLQSLAKTHANRVEQAIIEKGRLRAQIYALLDEEQKTKLKEMKEELVTHIGKRRRHHF